MATPLDAAALARFTSDHPDWAVDGEQISRTFTFADFAAAMAFVTRIALVAEAADHHPDIDIRWNRVTLTLSTHSVGALTGKDTEMAAVIDAWGM
jgi:4a-hydroxytetrahydrobiopterin dehydratase